MSTYRGRHERPIPPLTSDHAAVRREATELIRRAVQGRHRGGHHDLEP